MKKDFLFIVVTRTYGARFGEDEYEKEWRAGAWKWQATDSTSKLLTGDAWDLLLIRGPSLLPLSASRLNDLVSGKWPRDVPRAAYDQVRMVYHHKTTLPYPSDPRCVMVRYPDMSSRSRVRVLHAFWSLGIPSSILAEASTQLHLSKEEQKDLDDARQRFDQSGSSAPSPLDAILHGITRDLSGLSVTLQRLPDEPGVCVEIAESYRGIAISLLDALRSQIYIDASINTGKIDNDTLEYYVRFHMKDRPQLWNAWEAVIALLPKTDTDLRKDEPATLFADARSLLECIDEGDITVLAKHFREFEGSCPFNRWYFLLHAALDRFEEANSSL